MIKRQGRHTLQVHTPISILGYAAVAGKKESSGPLKDYFDKTFLDTKMDQKVWELSESELQKESFKSALEKTELTEDDIHCIFAGDLLNQCIGTTFSYKDTIIPVEGIYSACATFSQGLGLGTVYIASGAANYVAVSASSHFCSAERQFRFPLEYGGVRTPTAQWTCTAAGCMILSNKGDGPYITAVTPGIITDFDIVDPTNMGAAMAPAAARTISTYFDDTGSVPSDFDMIITGDLGKVGSKLLYEVLAIEGYDITANHSDCGLMIFDLDKQKVGAGGSGCGCSAATMSSYIMQLFEEKKISRVLYIATGAMLSKTSSLQKLSIPSIAHLTEISSSLRSENKEI